MKARRVVAVVLLGLGVFACSSSSDRPPPAGTDTPGVTPPAPSGTTPAASPGPAPAPVTQTIGTGGGSLNATGIVLTIPAGALPSDTAISITPSDGAIPAGYTGLSPLYTFSPDGT